MDISYFSGTLPFSSYLQLYFSVFISRENLDIDDFYDDDDDDDIDPDVFNL